MLTHTLDVFRRKFDYFRTNIGEMDELFEASFSSVADSGKFLSRSDFEVHITHCETISPVSVGF